MFTELNKTNNKEAKRMIKLGDTVDVKCCKITQMWLIKDLGLRKYTKDCYVTLGFQPGKGWWTLNNGSLKDMRAYIKKFAV